MKHDMIVIKSNRSIDTDWLVRRLAERIKEALKKVKEDREAGKLAMIVRDKED